MMKIAVGVNDFGVVASHLGKTSRFFIFEVNGKEVEFLEMRDSNSDKSNHIIEEIKDCSGVISGSIGEGMLDNLKKNGITAVIESVITDPEKAVEKNFIN